MVDRERDRELVLRWLVIRADDLVEVDRDRLRAAGLAVLREVARDVLRDAGFAVLRAFERDVLRAATLAVLREAGRAELRAAGLALLRVAGLAALRDVRLTADLAVVRDAVRTAGTACAAGVDDAVRLLTGRFADFFSFILRTSI